MTARQQHRFRPGTSDATNRRREFVPFGATTRDPGDGVRHLVLSGELDLAAVPELEYRLADGAGGYDCLVVDMSALTFLGSTGIRFLLELIARAERDGRVLRVVPGPRQVQRVFEILGVSDRVPFVDAAWTGEKTASAERTAG